MISLWCWIGWMCPWLILYAAGDGDGRHPLVVYMMHAAKYFIYVFYMFPDSYGVYLVGRVRTKTVKKASRVIIEKYYNRLTLDFDTNKRVAEEVAIIQSKRLRNKIAGFTTHLMKRIQRGPVRGISLKLQEEERERRMDFIPDQSAINLDNIEVDKDTMEMLRSMNMAQLPGVSVQGRDGRNRK